MYKLSQLENDGSIMFNGKKIGECVPGEITVKLSDEYKKLTEN